MQYFQITLAVLLMAIGANSVTINDFPPCGVRHNLCLLLFTSKISSLMISPAKLQHSIALSKRQEFD